MPNSLQYPLERQRDLLRKWNRVLQRTVIQSDRMPADSKYATLRRVYRTARRHTAATPGVPFNGVSEQNARLGNLIVLFGCSNEIAPIELDVFGDRAGKLIAASSSYQPVGEATQCPPAVNKSR